MPKRKNCLSLVQVLLNQRPIYQALRDLAISEHRFKMALNNLGPAVLGSTWGMFFLTTSMSTHKISTCPEIHNFFQY